MWSITRIKKAAGPLFLAATTTPSWSAQNPRCTKSEVKNLAYVGDAILEAIVREWLVEEQLPFDSVPNGNGERVSTRVLFLSAAPLFQAAHRIGLPKAMRLTSAERIKVVVGKGGSFNKTTLRILSETMEALVEAIRQHSGYSEAQAFVRENVIYPVMEMLDGVEVRFHEPRLMVEDGDNSDTPKTENLTFPMIHKIKREIKDVRPGLYRQINLIETDKEQYGARRIPMIAELLNQAGILP